MCSGRALAEPLVRMGEALGMTAVPLTPSGSAAHEAPLLAATVAAADAQQHGQQPQQRPVSSFDDGREADAAGQADGHGGLQGTGSGGAGSTADTEQSGPRYRTSSDD
jgi:hypothetical protein